MMSGKYPADSSAKKIEVSTFVIPSPSDYPSNWLPLASFIYLKPEMVICAMMCLCICVQMWMSAQWLTCARVSCVWTLKDRTPAGAVKPAFKWMRAAVTVKVRGHLYLSTCLEKFDISVCCKIEPKLWWTTVQEECIRPRTWLQKIFTASGNFSWHDLWDKCREMAALRNPVKSVMTSWKQNRNDYLNGLKHGLS